MLIDGSVTSLRKTTHLIAIAFSLFLYLTNLCSCSTENNDLLSAKDCQECHTYIYDDWSYSLHARSTVESSNFISQMANIYLSDSSSHAIEDCQKCHTPVLNYNSEWNIHTTVVQEGVTCEVCHKVTDVNENSGQYSFETVFNQSDIPDTAQGGPLNLTTLDSHPTFFAEVYDQSKFCYPCHLKQISEDSIGICVSGVIPDEQNSIPCQSCHMRSIPSEIVRGGDIRQMHSHFFEGSRSGDTYKEAIMIKAVYDGDQLELNLRNYGASHQIPQGPPWRIIAVQIQATDQQNHLLYENFSLDEDPIQAASDAVFARLLQDNEGNITFFPWRAKSVYKDNRIKSGEWESIQATIPRIMNMTLRIKTLLYLAAPPLIEKIELENPMFNEPLIMREDTIGVDTEDRIEYGRF